MKKQSHLVDLVCSKTADMVCTVFRERLLYFHVRCMQQGASRLIDDRWMEDECVISKPHMMSTLCVVAVPHVSWNRFVVMPVFGKACCILQAPEATCTVLYCIPIGPLVCVPHCTAHREEAAMTLKYVYAFSHFKEEKPRWYYRPNRSFGRYNLQVP
jgi:hypothetical protein